MLNAAGYYTAPSPGNVGVSLLNAQFNSDGTADLSRVYTDTDPRTYELSYYSYMITPTDSSFSAHVRARASAWAPSAEFALCQGQQQVDNLGYSALPVNLVEDGYQQLQKIPGAEVPAIDQPVHRGLQQSHLLARRHQPPGQHRPDAARLRPAGRRAVRSRQAGAAVTTTTVTAAPGAVSPGRPVTLTATVSSLAGPPAPAGSVQFEAGGTGIGAPVPPGLKRRSQHGRDVRLARDASGIGGVHPG